MVPFSLIVNGRTDGWTDGRADRHLSINVNRSSLLSKDDLKMMTTAEDQITLTENDTVSITSLQTKPYLTLALDIMHNCIGVLVTQSGSQESRGRA